MSRGSPISWTEAQLAWIEAHKGILRRESHAEFCKVFDVEVTFAAYVALCKRKGWKSGRAWRTPGYVNPWKDRNWSAEQLAWIEANKTRPRREAHAQFCALFKAVTFIAYIGLCKRKGWMTGRDGRLQPGNTPPNKGKKMPFNANRARTQFKKGQKPYNAYPTGHERMHEDGYVYISIDETNPHTGYARRFVLKHRHLWEQLHGPVPEGMALKCLDGNRQNTDPSNWECVDRGLLPILSGPHGLGFEDMQPEVKPVAMTMGKLLHSRTKRTRKKTAARKEDQHEQHQ